MENNNINNNSNAYTSDEQPKEKCKRTFDDKSRAMLAFKGILEVSHARKAVSAAVETLIERINTEGIKGIEVGDPVFVDMCAFALFESTKEPKLNPERLLYGVFKVLIADYVCELQKKNDKEAK